MVLTGIFLIIVVSVSLISNSFQYVNIRHQTICKRFASVISRRMSTADDAITIRSSTNDVLSEGTDASSTMLVKSIERKKVYGYDRWNYRTLGLSGRKLVYGYFAVRTALLKYHEINDHMLVPYKFVVPANDDRWPKDTWGMNLGIISSNIRSRNSYMAEREDLKSIGFIFSPEIQIYRYDLVRGALLLYQDLNSNMLVPLGFVVPTSDLTWPKEVWGMSLGMIVSNIRCGYYYGDKREDLKKIGFDYLLKIPNWGYDLIRAALITYQVLSGDMMVHREFVVPDSDIRWPKEMWGMNLGNFVGLIRHGSSYIDHRKDLESIGFDYSS